MYTHQWYDFEEKLQEWIYLLFLYYLIKISYGPLFLIKTRIWKVEIVLDNSPKLKTIDITRMLRMTNFQPNKVIN